MLVFLWKKHQKHQGMKHNSTSAQTNSAWIIDGHWKLVAFNHHQSLLLLNLNSGNMHKDTGNKCKESLHVEEGLILGAIRWYMQKKPVKVHALKICAIIFKLFFSPHILQHLNFHLFEQTAALSAGAGLYNSP